MDRACTPPVLSRPIQESVCICHAYMCACAPSHAGGPAGRTCIHVCMAYTYMQVDRLAARAMDAFHGFREPRRQMWLRWVRHVHTRRVAARFTAVCLSRGFNAWSAKASEDLSRLEGLLGGVTAMCHSRLAKAVRQWETVAREHINQLEDLSRAVGALRLRGLRCAVSSWVECVSTAWIGLGGLG